MHSDILKKRTEFVGIVDRARSRIGEKKYLSDKWLRPSNDLFDWYLREFLSAKIRYGSTVFDLGVGPGYFLWFLREFIRCDVSGIESKSREDYQILWQDMGLEGRVHLQKIQRFQPIICMSAYDYITATGICFNRIDGNRDDLWGVKEYLYFIKDVCTHLKPDGELYLRFNKLPTGDVFDFFKTLDARDGDSRFRIKRNVFLKSRYWSS